jgi:glycerol kinase
MAANDWFLQFLANILNITVERPVNVESTVVGAAFLAGLASGLYSTLDDVADLWSQDRQFEPNMAGSERDRLYDGWLDAVSRVRGTA